MTPGDSLLKVGVWKTAFVAAGSNRTFAVPNDTIWGVGEFIRLSPFEKRGSPFKFCADVMGRDRSPWYSTCTDQTYSIFFNSLTDLRAEAGDEGFAFAVRFCDDARGCGDEDQMQETCPNFCVASSCNTFQPGTCVPDDQ